MQSLGDQKNVIISYKKKKLCLKECKTERVEINLVMVSVGRVEL